MVARFISWVATVLTVYGIETIFIPFDPEIGSEAVATVLTVYGIETDTYTQKQDYHISGCNSTYRLRY